MERIDEEELGLVFPFWEKLTKRQKETLCSTVRRESYEKGTRISFYNSTIGCIVITKGNAVLSLFGEKETETELYRYAKDDICLIETGDLFACEKDDLVFQTLSVVEGYIIGKEETKNLLQNNIHFENYIARGLLQIFPFLIESIRQRDYLSLESRIIEVVLNEASRTRSHTIFLTHVQIASKIGSAREAVTRKLHELEEEGAVLCSRGKVQILSKEKLRKKQTFQQ